MNVVFNILKHMFLTISYLSNASEKLTDDDIDALMIDTKEFNNANHISGILIYSDLTFFQVIEGDYNTIISLFERIQNDYRHYNILKILETKSPNRKYHRYATKFIIHYKNKASLELSKLLENDDVEVIDQQLHSLIVYQSKVLMNLD